MVVQEKQSEGAFPQRDSNKMGLAKEGVKWLVVNCNSRNMPSKKRKCGLVVMQCVDMSNWLCDSIIRTASCQLVLTSRGIVC